MIDPIAPIVAIISFLMLFATFAVGLRCFADFDKDLRPAKTRGLFACHLLVSFLLTGNTNYRRKTGSRTTAGIKLLHKRSAIARKAFRHDSTNLILLCRSSSSSSYVHRVSYESCTSAFSVFVHPSTIVYSPLAYVSRFRHPKKVSSAVGYLIATLAGPMLSLFLLLYHRMDLSQPLYFIYLSLFAVWMSSMTD